MFPVIFEAVGEGRPNLDHGRTSARDWSPGAPRMVCLDELITTKTTLVLERVRLP